MNCNSNNIRKVALKATKSLSKAEVILADLRAAGVQLHQDTLLEVYKEHIAIGYMSSYGHLVSEIRVRCISKYNNSVTLNSATYGDFDPNKKVEAVVSAMHTAQLLMHWDAVCQIMAKHFPYEPTK